GIETRAHAVGQWRTRVEGPPATGSPAECHWTFQCSIAADELAPVAGPVRLAASEIGEGNARCERRVPWITGKHRARRGVDLGRHESRGSSPRWPEDPFHVSGHRKAPGAARQIHQREARNL